ncbi:MAG: extracellular solute-binding protein [Oscillospiraceae bacterium]|nr:extracellular solute-binding protein [Oscillospiraceae bacterium]
MKKWTKMLCLTASFMLVFSLLAACGGSGGGTTSATTAQTATEAAETKADATTEAQQSTDAQQTTDAQQATTQTPAEQPKDVQLRMSWWGGEARHEATINAINLYQEKNPHVKISPEYSGWDGYYQKLVTQLASKTEPDVIQIDASWITDLHSDEIFVDLLGQQGLVDSSTFDPGFLNGYCLVNGKLIGLITGISGNTLVINKDLLDQHNITLNDNWTWDDFIDYGKALYQADNSATFFLTESDGFDPVVHSFLRQLTGGQVIRDDFTIEVTQEQVQQMFQFVADMVEYNIIVPFSESAPLEGRINEYPAWINGKVGVATCSPSYYAEFKQTYPGNLDVIPLPKFADARISGNPAWPANILSVSINSQNQDEALKFMDWFLNDSEAALILGTVRSIPVSSAARQALINANLIDPAVDKAVNITLQENCEPESQIGLNEEIKQTIIVDLVQQVGFNRLTPEQAAQQFMDKLTVQLDELKGQ